MGLSMTVTASVHYVVQPAHYGQPILDRTITTPYTAAWGDAFVGVERLRRADEGAMRANIAQFVAALAAAPVAGVPAS